LWRGYAGIEEFNANPSGPDLVDYQARNDMYWLKDDGGARLKPVVELALSELELKYCKAMPAFEAVVRLIRQLLDVEPLTRPTARDLKGRLDHIRLEAEKELLYDTDLYLRISTQNQQDALEMPDEIKTSLPETTNVKSELSAVLRPLITSDHPLGLKEPGKLSIYKHDA
jgi:hypothetical protein